MLPAITWRAERDQESKVPPPVWRARLSLLVGGFTVLLILLGLALPAWYRQHVWQRLEQEMQRRFGEDYAVMAVHTHGEDNADFSVWPSLIAWWRDEGFANYHFAVLVSDNDRSHVFYWSFREDRWVRDGSRQLRHRSPDEQAQLRFHPQGRGRLHGLWARQPLLLDAYWY